MEKAKKIKREKPVGISMVLTVPVDLHTEIRVDQIRGRKDTLQEVVLEYLRIGYNAHHNGYKAKANG